MADYSHIISLIDLERKDSLAGSDPKDFVLSYSFAKKFWSSPQIDRGTIVKTRRVKLSILIITKKLLLVLAILPTDRTSNNCFLHLLTITEDS